MIRFIYLQSESTFYGKNPASDIRYCGRGNSPARREGSFCQGRQIPVGSHRRLPCQKKGSDVPPMTNESGGGFEKKKYIT